MAVHWLLKFKLFLGFILDLFDPKLSSLFHPVL